MSSSKNPDKHFREKKIVNFGIIYKSICGEKISEIDLKNYWRIKDERVREHPQITYFECRGKILKLQHRKCFQNFIQFIILLIVYKENIQWKVPTFLFYRSYLSWWGFYYSCVLLLPYSIWYCWFNYPCVSKKVIFIDIPGRFISH